MSLFFIRYLFIRILTYPFGYLSYPLIHKLGGFFGSLAYYFLPHFRKRALSHLALASSLHLSSRDIPRLAKASFQNLMITCLEYPRLAREKDLSRIVHCVNPQKAEEILQTGKGIIFFCGHQANWELLFLEGSRRMPGGVAIGRPIKNPFLYRWILSIRQKYGGKLITPKEATKEGLKTLKKGGFLGIVGDQGMPDSGYKAPFLGRSAWTSPLPAILSYRTNCPIIVVMTKREKGHYTIRYSDPIWPDLTQAHEEEIPHLMQQALTYLEKSIQAAPEEWLWQHNRWKQQSLDRLKAPFRQDALCIILPEEKELFSYFYTALPTLKKLYPTEWITCILPEKYSHLPLPPDIEKKTYASLQELLLPDWRFKLVFNFSGYEKVGSHFLSLSAFSVLTLKDLYTLSRLSPKQNPPLELLLTNALLKECHHAR